MLLQELRGRLEALFVADPAFLMNDCFVGTAVVISQEDKVLVVLRTDPTRSWHGQQRDVLRGGVMSCERRYVTAATVDDTLLWSVVGGDASGEVACMLGDLSVVSSELVLVLGAEIFGVAISLNKQRLDEADMTGFESHSLRLLRVVRRFLQDS